MSNGPETYFIRKQWSDTLTRRLPLKYRASTTMTFAIQTSLAHTDAIRCMSSDLAGDRCVTAPLLWHAMKPCPDTELLPKTEQLQGRPETLHILHPFLHCFGYTASLAH
jgi:hypothetical protein